MVKKISFSDELRLNSSMFKVGPANGRVSQTLIFGDEKNEVRKIQNSSSNTPNRKIKECGELTSNSQVS